jgi:hypothetical protein
MRGPGPRSQATGSSKCGLLLLAVHYRCPVCQSPSDELIQKLEPTFQNLVVLESSEPARSCLQNQ